jgi:hypothetical protein
MGSQTVSEHADSTGTTLGSRRERPTGCRAAQQCEEFASFHSDTRGQGIEASVAPN